MRERRRSQSKFYQLSVGTEHEKGQKDLVPEQPKKLHEAPFAEKWMDQVNQHLIYMQTAHKAWTYACMEAPEPLVPTDAFTSQGVWAGSNPSTPLPLNDERLGLNGSGPPVERNVDQKPASLQSLALPDFSGLELNSPDGTPAADDAAHGAAVLLSLIHI